MSEINPLKTIKESHLATLFKTLAVAVTMNGVIHAVKNPLEAGSPKNVTPEKLKQEILKKTGDLLKGSEICVEGPPLDNETYTPTVAEWTKFVNKVNTQTGKGRSV